MKHLFGALFAAVVAVSAVGQIHTDPEPPPHITVMSCPGCKLTLDIQPGNLPLGVSVSVTWGSSVKGKCTPSAAPTPTGCDAKSCSFKGLVITITNNSNVDQWLHDDRWTKVPKNGSVTISPDDEPYACGAGLYEVFYPSRDTQSMSTGSFKVMCSNCPE
jgi:hypothetical protein